MRSILAVIYACGHKGLVELCGLPGDRRRKLDFLATRICSDCQVARRGPVVDRDEPLRIHPWRATVPLGGAE